MPSLLKLREYLEFDPENSSLALELIEQLAQQGEFHEALTIVERSYQWHSEDPHFISWQAHLRLALKDYDSAISDYQRLFALGFDQVGLRINCALAQFQMGQYKEANLLLESVAELDAGNQILKARCLAQLEEVNTAISELSQLLIDCPEEKVAETIGLLSLLYLDDAQYALAEEYCHKALVLNDQQFDARITLASLYVYKVDTDKAMELLVPLDSEYPNTGRILALKALVHMYQQDMVQAIVCYEPACDLMPYHVGSRVNLGWCYFANQDLVNAEECFKTAVEIDRTFAEGHGGLAILYAYSNKWSESQKLLKRALKLDPQCPSALYARALYFEHKGRDKEATQLLNLLMSHKTTLSKFSLAELIAKSLGKK